jgi:hypothetical protein
MIVATGVRCRGVKTGFPVAIKAPDASRGTPRRSGSRRPCQPVSPKCPARPNTNRSRPMGRSPVACAPGFYGGHAQPGPTPGRRRRRENIPVACAPGLYGGHAQPVPTPGRRRRPATCGPRLPRPCRQGLSVTLACHEASLGNLGGAPSGAQSAQGQGWLGPRTDRATSSIGQSTSFTPRGLGVRVPRRPFTAVWSGPCLGRCGTRAAHRLTSDCAPLPR